MEKPPESSDQGVMLLEDADPDSHKEKGRPAIKKESWGRGKGRGGELRKGGVQKFNKTKKKN